MEHFIAQLKKVQDCFKEADDRGCREVKIEVDHVDIILKQKKVRVWYSSGIIEEFTT